MRTLRWSHSAARDLEAISAYLRRHHPAYFKTTLQRFYSAAKRLREFPQMGRVGWVIGTRELPLQPLPYLLIYSVEEETVSILRILHTSRER